MIHYILWFIRLIILLLLTAGIGIQITCETLTKKERIKGFIEIAIDILLLYLI